MAPGLFRKRRAPAAPAEPAGPTPPASTATRPPPAIATAASTREPPRSYAQLADLADEIVASSWDSNLPLHLWLEGVRKLSTESEVYRNEGNYDMAFVRVATVLKLLKEVLPFHHPDWRTLTAAQLDSVRQHDTVASTAHAALKNHLIARTASFYAARSSAFSSRATTPTPTSSSHLPSYSPALTLRNTVTTAATVYRDGPGPAHGPPPAPGAHPRRSGLQAHEPAPPRSNRLRAAFSRAHSHSGSALSGEAGGTAAQGVLPEPGAADDAHEDAGSPLGPSGLGELVPRGQGRRIPKLGEAVVRQAPLVSSGWQAPPRSYEPAAQQPSAPMPLPGDDDGSEDDEGAAGTVQVPPPQRGEVVAAAWARAGAHAAGWAPPPLAPSTFGSAAATDWAAEASRPGSFVESSARSARQAAPPAPPPNPSWPTAHPLLYAHPPQHLHSYPLPLPPPHPASLGSHPPPPPFPPPAFPPHLVPFLAPLAPLPPSAPPPPSHAAPPGPSAPPATTPTPEPFVLPKHDSLVGAPAPSAPSPAPSSPSPAPASSFAGGRGGIGALGQSFAALAVREQGEVRAGRGADGSSIVAEPIARNEAGVPLRPVVLPSRLISHFMHAVAAHNTALNIETCGLLLGTQKDGKLVVSHLLVPKQEGTPDTCSATNDEETFAFQEQRGLMTLGWIHTHPTQSIFLSSLDLHTHLGFQLLLREAIAVVCAPIASDDEPQCGVFRMTDPPGMGAVAACREGGAFHPHPPLPLYTDVDEEGGHCHVDDDAPFECVDMR